MGYLLINFNNAIHELNETEWLGMGFFYSCDQINLSSLDNLYETNLSILSW